MCDRFVLFLNLAFEVITCRACFVAGDPSALDMKSGCLESVRWNTLCTD